MLLNLLMELWWSFMSTVWVSAWRVYTAAVKCQSLLVMSTGSFCSQCLISWIINLSLFAHVFSNEFTQLVNNRIFYLCYLRDENDGENLTFVWELCSKFWTSACWFVKAFSCSVAINPIKREKDIIILTN